MSDHLARPNDSKLLLVGAGAMAADYAKILIEMKVPFEAISRQTASAQKFQSESGIRTLSGGVETLPVGKFDRAIVAVGVDHLASVAEVLLAKGVRHILLEKPGALHAADLGRLVNKARQNSAEIFIAYNRRFYSSVMALEERLVGENLISIHFEFTEWSHRIGPLEMPMAIKTNWLLANSSHVIDLAFFLAGRPKSMNCMRGGNLDWHPAGGLFVGSGVTENNILFTYHSNWLSAGRWGVEVMTDTNKYILRPLEELRVQPRGQLVSDLCAVDDSLDKTFKAGLFRQVGSFLKGEFGRMLSVGQQRDQFENIFEPILKGQTFGRR